MFKALRAIGHIFGLCNSNNPVNKYEVLFGGDAAGHGEHGSIMGTWVKQGHKQPINISFFFKGMGHAPRMTEEVLAELFKHARFVGIVPTHLYAYGGLHNPRPQPGVRYAT